MTGRWRTIRFSATLALIAILVAAFAGTVSAHETRDVDDYQLTVGFMEEPAYVNELNGIHLSVTRGSGEDGEPVSGVDQTLRAAIIYGDQTREVDLRPVFGEEGLYTADVIPTSAGSYAFQFVGEIEGQEIDETFRSGPDTFDDVESRAALEFPQESASTARDSDQAAAFGIAGVVAGLLGMAAGGAAYFKVSNNSPQRSRTTRAQQQRESGQE